VALLQRYYPSARRAVFPMLKCPGISDDGRNTREIPEKYHALDQA
jgi:hypothetical protein